jgi:alpha-tubulin suppressor-like RCC1 family protein
MDKDNKVFCWGTNVSGEIGDGTNTDRDSAVAVIDLGSVADLAVGAQHNCAIISPTVIKCWGNNEYGQLGNNTTRNSSVPVLVILPSGVGQ